MDRNSRLPSLTGLRWAAALIVFGQHVLEQYYNPQLVAAKPVRSAVWAVLAHGGGLGVSFFFVLSGFVLAWSAQPGERAHAFWWRRFSKVYPATLVTTLVAAAVVGGAGPVQLATHLTLTQSWVPRRDVYAALNLVSWSLSCEVFFYLCFPLLLAGMRRLGPAGLWAIAVMMVESVAALSVNLVHAQQSTAVWVGYVLPPVRMAEFTLGIAAALLVRSGAWRGPGLRWSLVLLPPASVAGLFTPYPVSEHAVTLIPVTLIVAAAARADLRGERTLWSRPLTVYLGEVSFAFYLVHFLVITAFNRYGLLPHQAGPAQALAATASVLWFSLIAAMIVYHGIELPALRLLRRALPAPALPAATRGRHRLVLTAAPPPRFVATVPMPRQALPSPPATAASPPAQHDPVPKPRPEVPEPHYAVPEPRGEVFAQDHAVPAQDHAVPEPHSAVPEPRFAVPEPRHEVPEPRSAVPEPRDVVFAQDHVVPAQDHVGPEPHYAVPEPRHEMPEPYYAVPEPRSAVPERDVVFAQDHAVPEQDHVGPEPHYAVPEPRHEVPEPSYAVPEPHYAVPEPHYAVLEPRHEVSEPRHEVPEPYYALPEPHYAVPEPRHAVAAQHNAGPEPRHAVVAQDHTVPERDHAVPEPQSAVPGPRHAVPTRRYAVPEPHHAVPGPRHAVPAQDHAAPEPRHAVPEPRHAVPARHHAVPELDHAVPEPRHAVPESGHAVPEPRHAVPAQHRAVAEPRHADPAPSREDLAPSDATPAPQPPTPSHRRWSMP